MIDVSGVFPKVTIVSTGIPPLINVTKFADDSNPVDVEHIEVTGHAVNVCGELVTWEKPSAYLVSISVLCGTDDDAALTLLLEESHARAGAGFSLAPTVNMRTALGKRNVLGVVTTDDGTTYTNGRIVSGRPGAAIDSEGKKLSNTYMFVFENAVPA
jgi:hypothetical protein